MKEMWDRMQVLMNAGAVKRLHTVRSLQDYPVSSHVYGAQIIAVELCRLNDVAAGDVLAVLLYHDAPEVETGDVPAPTKRALAADAQSVIKRMEAFFYHAHDIHQPATLTNLQAEIVKAADVLDLCWFCLEERKLGNRSEEMRRVFNNACSYLEGMTAVGVQETKMHLQREWNFL